MQLKKSTRTNIKRRRSTKGATLTELLVASVLLATTMAVMAELVSLTVVANSKLNRQYDAQVASNVSIDRITRDVRMAHQILPFYPKTTPTEFLNAQTLIVELPIYYLSKTNDPNDPAYIAAAPQNPLNGVTLPGHDTFIYKVVSDPLNPGEFMLQCGFKAEVGTRIDPSCSYRKEIDPPMPIVRGIIGPIPIGATPGAPPAVFTYLAKNPFPLNDAGHLDRIKESSLQSASLAENQYVADSVSGCAIDLELRRADQNQSQSQQAENLIVEKNLGVHSEAIIRLRHRTDSSIYLTSEHQFGPTEQQYYEQ